MPAINAVRALLFSLTIAASALAQQPPTTDKPGSTIENTLEAGADAAIRERLLGIYAEIDALSKVEVRVSQGVVTLSGAAPDQQSIEQAGQIAERISGVAAVQNRTTASLDVAERISPFIARIDTLTDRAVSAAPLILLATIVFMVITAAGFALAAWSGLWRRITPNPFVADLAAQAIRVFGLVLGVVIALNLAGATALMAAILGGAGVIGLSVGLAVRDSLENYISSIMLSLRQPFRANDHVVIDGNEGKVVRLTSRATVLMTLDGNHLRIPNATVYKAIILNYTRNPERRLQFELGVDASDDPQSAIATGIGRMKALSFVLKDPAPEGTINAVGDSNIILTFTAWINQNDADFLKARSEAIRATKMALEQAGFTLPEPIYRLRIDQLPNNTRLVTDSPDARPARTASAFPPQPSVADVSVAPDDHLDEKIAAERRETGDEDLLDPGKPTE